jgi:hypothetical protein
LYFSGSMAARMGSWSPALSTPADTEVKKSDAPATKENTVDLILGTRPKTLLEIKV